MKYIGKKYLNSSESSYGVSSRNNITYKYIEKKETIVFRFRR